MRLHDVQIDDALLAAFCCRNQIRELSFFGSVTREDFRSDSDIDVIVDFAGEERHSLLGLAGLQLELSGMLARQVHLHTHDMLHPYLRKQIRGAARVAYAA